MTSPPSSVNGPARGTSWMRILPFVILLLGAIVLGFKWNDIPDRWAVHWGINGQPDRWAAKSPFGVFLPVAAGALVCCFLEGVAWIVKATARRRSELSVETATAVAALTADLVLLLEIAIAIVFVYIGAVLPLSRPVSPVRLVEFMLVVITGAIVFGIVRLWRGVRDLKRAGHKGLEGYNGIIYKNADDPRLWVPKMMGIGYTLNFAHPWAWPILIAILSIPVAVILIVTLARLS
jgi:uncharacterized membrane protein